MRRSRKPCEPTLAICAPPVPSIRTEQGPRKRNSARSADDPNEPRHQDHQRSPDATAEIKAIASQGMKHPSTKPVLAGAAIGAVAGWILPVVGPIIGGIAGAGIVLYKRVRP